VWTVDTVGTGRYPTQLLTRLQKLEGLVSMQGAVVGWGGGSQHLWTRRLPQEGKEHPCVVRAGPLTACALIKYTVIFLL
jgi:hypothetical protein